MNKSSFLSEKEYQREIKMWSQKYDKASDWGKVIITRMMETIETLHKVNEATKIK